MAAPNQLSPLPHLNTYPNLLPSLITPPRSFLNHDPSNPEGRYVEFSMLNNSLLHNNRKIFFSSVKLKFISPPPFLKPSFLPLSQINHFSLPRVMLVVCYLLGLTTLTSKSLLPIFLSSMLRLPMTQTCLPGSLLVSTAPQTLQKSLISVPL